MRKNQVERVSYHNAKQRCTNPKHEHWARYGKRGIEFRYASFAQFLADVGPKPAKEYELDRIDNDGHYEPGNMRWTTASISAANRDSNRNTSGYKGVHFNKQMQKYAVRIRIEGKQYHLGYFEDAATAAEVYRQADSKRRSPCKNTKTTASNGPAPVKHCKGSVNSVATVRLTTT